MTSLLFKQSPVYFKLQKSPAWTAERSNSQPETTKCDIMETQWIINKSINNHVHKFQTPQESLKSLRIQKHWCESLVIFLSHFYNKEKKIKFTEACLQQQLTVQMNGALHSTETQLFSPWSEESTVSPLTQRWEVNMSCSPLIRWAAHVGQRHISTNESPGSVVNQWISEVVLIQRELTQRVTAQCYKDIHPLYKGEGTRRGSSLFRSEKSLEGI